MAKRRVSRVSRSVALRAVLDDPLLPVFVRSLSPRSLARMCQRVGVPDAASIMALAPGRLLVQALDSSVWRSPGPGRPEVFDARELIDWIGTWLDIGTAFTAERLAAVSDEDLTLYLSQVVRVSTNAMWGFERSTEIGNLDRIYAPSDDETAYGPYVVRALRKEDWETVRGALDAMWSDAPERLLQLFAQLTADESMLAPDTNRQGANRDSVLRRESARERRGHVTAAGARAFLVFGRRTSMRELLALSEYDLETRRHLAGLATAEDGELRDRSLTHDPIFREAAPRGEGGRLVVRTEDSGYPDEPHFAALRASLEAAGLLDGPSGQPLLSRALSERRAIVALLEQLADEHPIAFDARGRELAYLASVLIAGVAKEDRVLAPEDAWAAALATCNLGLELSEARGARARIEAEPGLVRLFLVGWRTLSEIPDRVVKAFVGSLDALKSTSPAPLHAWLVEQAEISVTDLREAVANRDFTAAREAAMVLAFVFDPNVCRAVVPLLDELPRLPAGESGGTPWVESLNGLETIGKLLRRLSAKRPP